MRILRKRIPHAAADIKHIIATLNEARGVLNLQLPELVVRRGCPMVPRFRNFFVSGKKRVMIIFYERQLQVPVSLSPKHRPKAIDN